jgi:cyanophycinase
MTRLAVALLSASALWAQTSGPEHGALVIAGGGTLGPAIITRFIELAGGPAAPVVVIAEADRERFVEPLRRARGVWFDGGRQWRLVDSYLGTRTERELFALLGRGGVIGGTSAGATIQGSYLVRGARAGNTLMMAPGYEKGMGFLKVAAIDQHLLTRKRQEDMVPVVKAHPELLGIGIDESTAIVVQGDRFEVVGESKVAIYEAGKPYFFLSAGDRFDVKARRKVQ